MIIHLHVKERENCGWRLYFLAIQSECTIKEMQNCDGKGVHHNLWRKIVMDWTGLWRGSRCTEVTKNCDGFFKNCDGNVRHNENVVRNCDRTVTIRHKMSTTVTDCDGSVTIQSSFFSLRTSRLANIILRQHFLVACFGDLPHPQPATTRPFKSGRRRTDRRRSNSGRRGGWRWTGGRRSAPNYSLRAIWNWVFFKFWVWWVLSR